MRLEYTIPPMQVMFFQAAPFAESEQFDVTVPGGMYISETLRTTGAVSPGAMCSANFAELQRRDQDYTRLVQGGNEEDAASRTLLSCQPLRPTSRDRQPQLYHNVVAKHHSSHPSRPRRGAHRAPCGHRSRSAFNAEQGLVYSVYHV